MTEFSPSNRSLIFDGLWYDKSQKEIEPFDQKAERDDPD
jgi:hypothetical protein